MKRMVSWLSNFIGTLVLIEIFVAAMVVWGWFSSAISQIVFGVPDALGNLIEKVIPSSRS